MYFVYRCNVSLNIFLYYTIQIINKILSEILSRIIMIFRRCTHRVDCLSLGKALTLIQSDHPVPETSQSDALRYVWYHNGATFRSLHDDVRTRRQGRAYSRYLGVARIIRFDEPCRINCRLNNNRLRLRNDSWEFCLVKLIAFQTLFSNLRIAPATPGHLGRTLSSVCERRPIAL